MEHRENCLAEKALTGFLISYCTQIIKKKKNLSSARSHTERVRDKPGKTLQDKMFCVPCKNPKSKIIPTQM